MGRAATSRFRVSRKANSAADVRALIATVTSIGYAPNGQSIFTGESDKAANLWRASDGLSLWRVRHGQNGCGTVSDVAYSPDNTIVATLNGCDLKLWNVADGTLIRTINSGGVANAGFAAVGLAFSPDGLFVASSSQVAYHNATITIWRVADGALVRTISDGGGHALAFSPDGQIIASTSIISPIGLGVWNVVSGTLLRTIAGVAGIVAFSRRV